MKLITSDTKISSEDAWIMVEFVYPIEMKARKSPTRQAQITIDYVYTFL